MPLRAERSRDRSGYRFILAHPSGRLYGTAMRVPSAVEAAELRYERLHRVHDWTLYADFLELEVDGKKVDYCPPV
jgi:hypothetical protein